MSRKSFGRGFIVIITVALSLLVLKYLTGTSLPAFAANLYLRGANTLKITYAADVFEAAKLNGMYVGSKKDAPLDCARIMHLNQLNSYADSLLMQCAHQFGGYAYKPSSGPPAGGRRYYSPANYGGADVDVITGEDSSNYPKVTQSESFVWGNGNTVIVQYNDSIGRHAYPTPSNSSGLSYSTDGGASFTRILPSPFSTGHGDNRGDPIVVYNAKLQTWFAGDLVSATSSGGCGQGMGIGLWTSPDGINWSVGGCAHNNDLGPSQMGGDDRESMWVDNNPDSQY